MSRIGFQPITIPENVEMTINDSTITVKGKNGELTRNIHEGIELEVEGNEMNVKRANERKETRSIHGTTRSLIQNMIEGVQDGFTKELEITGVGYRAQKQGTKLIISAGYSHLVEIEEPEGIEFEVPENTKIIIKGIDKELVGTVAARVRATKVPEPYKGKGIRYKDEYVRRKEGKTAT